MIIFKVNTKMRGEIKIERRKKRLFQEKRMVNGRNGTENDNRRRRLTRSEEKEYRDSNIREGEEMRRLDVCITSLILEETVVAKYLQDDWNKNRNETSTIARFRMGCEGRASQH